MMFEKKIDTAIRFFLYLLIFWLPYSGAVVETSVIAALLLWIVKRFLFFVRGKKEKSRYALGNILAAFRPPESILNTPIYFFLLVCVLSTAGSVFLGQSVHGFLTKTLEWFIVYFLIVEVFTSRKHVVIFLWVVLISSGAVIADGLLQFYVTHTDIFSGLAMGGKGVRASFRHPNALGSYLVFISSTVFSFLFFRQKKRNLLALWILLILVMWVFSLTFSRGAWIGCMAGILFCVFCLKRKMFYTSAVAMAGLVVAFYLIFPSSFKHNFRMDSSNLENTADWRMGVWADSLKMVKERPFFGHGLNTYMRVFQNYRRESGGFSLDSPTYAHNCYIQLAAETGLLGLFCFLWIFGKLFKQAAQNHFKEKNDVLTYLVIGLLGGTLAFLWQSFFDVHFYTLQLSVLIWYMVGITVCTDKLLNRLGNRDIKVT